MQHVEGRAILREDVPHDQEERRVQGMRAFDRKDNRLDSGHYQHITGLQITEGHNPTPSRVHGTIRWCLEDQSRTSRHTPYLERSPFYRATLSSQDTTDPQQESGCRPFEGSWPHVDASVDKQADWHKDRSIPPAFHRARP